jgi:hypothetical protein
MPYTTHDSPRAAPRVPGNPAWLLGFVRALALLSLLLLPIQIRARTQHPHPHALLQLVLDASDGSFDHHALGDEATSPPHDHSEEVAAAEGHQPDLPSLGPSVSALGGLVVLVALIISPLIPPALAERTWRHPARWRGRVPTLEPPPPRATSV